MALSLRKTVSFGPFRFTLSGQGLGASVGVQGMRFGTGPRGAYVSVSGGGISYRKTLGGGGDDRRTPGHRDETRGGAEQELTSGSVDEMRDASADDLLDELNAGLKHRDNITGLVLGVCVMAMFMLPGTIALVMISPEGTVRTPEESAVRVALVAVAAIVLLVIIAMTYVVRRRHQLRSTTVLLYDLDPAAEAWVERLRDAIEVLRASAGVWHIATETSVRDRKRNAGASSLVSRTAARPVFTTNPMGAVSNLPIPVLGAGREALLFTPDRLLVCDQKARRYGAVPYPEIRLRLTTTRFIENLAPRDAEIVDHTWANVNKDGSPDRRFANNRRLPVCRYGELTLSSASGLLEQYQFSLPNAADQLVAALREAGATVEGELDTETDGGAVTPPPDEATGLDLRTVALVAAYRYVAAADRKFSDAEREAIRGLLREEFSGRAWVEAGQVDSVIDAVSPDTGPQAIANVLAQDDLETRHRLMHRLESLTTADGKATPKEKQRLAEIRAALGL